MSEIQEVFRGAQVFITGSTGFLGRLLLEKLLRTCHEVEAIYLLMRPKKGKSEAERFNTLFDDGHLFEKLKNERPDFYKKVHCIVGDCGSPGLGISETDRELIKQQVNFVFHIAATVKFDEELQKAFTINVCATKEIMTLTKEIRNLKGIVHMSTAYSNCPRKFIGEEFYKPGMSAEDLENLTSSLDRHTLNILTPHIIGKWPNTYTFTKCVAEDVVKEMAEGLPVAIVRPSIVVSTAKEPISYWINNIYGAAGVAFGAGIGLIRVVRTRGDAILDVVPADMVINNCIAAAWHIAETRPRNAVIYNYTSGGDQPITYNKYRKYLSEGGVLCPSEVCIWYYSLCFQPNRMLHRMLVLLLHTFPAILVDLAAVLIRKKPRLMRGYMKIHHFMEVLGYFGLKEWIFKNDNVHALWNRLNKTDKDLFCFDLASLDWSIFMHYMLRGMRLYVVGDSFDTLPKAKAKYHKLKILHYVIVYGFWLLIIWFMFEMLKCFYRYIIPY